jgi:hypothetical protein
LYENSSALLFAASAQQNIEELSFQKLGEILGVYWTRDTVDAMMNPKVGTKRPKGPRKDLLVPLALIMQPKLQDFIRDTFGSAGGISAPGWYQEEDKDEVVEGYEMKRQDFINLASMFTGLIPRNFYAVRDNVSLGRKR